MSTKLFYLLVPLIFSGCLASLSHDKSQELTDRARLNKNFLEAARNGSIGLMTDLLKQGVKLNARGSFNRTALHEAAQRGHLDCVRALIEAKVDVNARDNYDETALHWATYGGHLACVKALIEAKADVNVRNNAGWTALHWAARQGRLACVNALIEAKADVNIRDKGGTTALHWATMEGYLACLKALLEAKADVNVRNNDGATALHWAARAGYFDCVKTLVKYSHTLVPSEKTISHSRRRIFDAPRRDAEKGGNTILHWAASEGHLVCVKALIEVQADVNARDSNGETALYRAASECHLDCVKALIEAKADVNICDKDGVPALHRAAANGHLACLKALLEAKADINARSNYGRTALYWAAENNDPACVKALIESKIDLYACDDLAWALRYGHVDCVKTLVKYSYTLVPSIQVVSESRRRILKGLGVFVGLRNQHLQLAGLKDTTLQYEILSWDRSLQEDLVVILLDELKKGKEIKNVALIRSKEAAVSYLLPIIEKKLSERVGLKGKSDLYGVRRLEDLIREGLDERINQLKVKNRK